MGQMQRRWHRFAFFSMLFLLCLCPIPSFSSNEETRYVAEDSKGNTTFSCDASGPCIPCSYSEKQTDEYHCKQTGFHQPFKCMEMKTDRNSGQTKRDSQLPSGMLLENLPSRVLCGNYMPSINLVKKSTQVGN
jgi:hypothetical protein